jgi:glyoxylase-like metal-dependent hydrolase (beta-lactamase superfamily II)/rhodanese-related sulfurtransferase
MDVTSFRTPGLGDQSYLLTHEGRGVLVDPQRDIDRFLSVAAERDVELRFVLETHLHNDYVSGGEQAAMRTGAELVMPAAAAPAYRHTPAFHGEEIDGGAGLTIRPLHTPGHTPEHTSYLVLIDGAPVAVFSGGSLLVGSAGRPDLLGPERAHSLAVLQHGSLHRLARLPRGVGLYPTHGAGSFCTVTGAGRYTSTIGDEVDGNPLLAAPDAEQFADTLMATPMPIPAFYPYMGPANTLGVPVMPPLDTPRLTVGQIPADAAVVDVRSRAAQADGSLPGALGIELTDDFGSWAGWLVPRGKPIVLVADSDSDVPQAMTQLAQIGVDTVVGVVRDLPGDAATARYERVDTTRFAALAAEPGAQVLDVRMPHERAGSRFEGAVECFLPDLLTDGVPAELDPQRPVLVACAGGRRAGIAATVLVDAGYRVVALDGAGIPDVLRARSLQAA